ncbi:GNAT family N-acetyltransferase [Maribacter algarum]|uniref:GNAT family N-acetyltransferase n=1 Tax=Maribacter algarum (ex Zhang et al. 2020) TaxID=2578118 RepID=A0A5S3PU21_9FLAO|nr:GNAT family N-acetyltransferase [Maribacter algarum]TMM57423.1 GNAT family N-acetyltransferase [Maribacter algarum]
MREGFYISVDKNLLDIDFIQSYMTNDAYWGKGRTLEQTKGTIENSFCFGMYTNENAQIGFARVVTDYTFYGNIMDVIISPAYQGQGLGTALIEFMLSQETIQSLQTLSLKTKDAHGLYNKYGFTKIGKSPLWMSRDKQKLD